MNTNNNLEFIEQVDGDEIELGQEVQTEKDREEKILDLVFGVVDNLDEIAMEAAFINLGAKFLTFTPATSEAPSKTRYDNKSHKKAFLLLKSEFVKMLDEENAKIEAAKAAENNN